MIQELKMQSENSNFEKENIKKKEESLQVKIFGNLNKL